MSLLPGSGSIQDLVDAFILQRAKRIDDACATATPLGHGVAVISGETGTQVLVTPRVPPRHVYEFPSVDAWSAFQTRVDG